ncbi:MAG: NB-ARC domain-containing protein [Chloroflexota bacterium]|nr:NB-ARC domain-containing protein [Chloroflexota bacterium]
MVSYFALSPPVFPDSIALGEPDLVGMAETRITAMQDQSLDSLREQVKKTLSQWGKGSSEHALKHLQLVRKRSRESGVSQTQAANQVLFEALERLEMEAPQGARILQLHYLEGMSMQQVANRSNRAQASCFNIQRRAIDRLAKIIDRQESELLESMAREATARLGLPSYDRLFGVDAHLDELQSLVRRSAQPWLILLEGIGGIGKTSLADALARRVLAEGDFDGIVWTTARKQVFRLSGHIETVVDPVLSAEALVERLAEQVIGDMALLPVPFDIDRVLPILQQHLDERPHLLVIDNLETVVDLETLLPSLASLANPSKVLLTSRTGLQDMPNIFRLNVPPLSQDDARALLRYEAQLRNAVHLAAASDGDLNAIYASTGGNPLVLRLVVGQTLVHDLPTILQSLGEARGQTVDQLYTYIYWQAWNNLDENAQRALLVMPLVPPKGQDLDFLVRISGLDRAQMVDALESLVNLNLVDRRGDLHQSRYTIHPLTHGFLQEQVAKWQ